MSYQLQLNTTNKRGLAYNCNWCPPTKPYVAEKYRVESHIWKHHIPLDRSPFYYTMCMFKSTNLKDIRKHLTTFKPHVNRRLQMEAEGTFTGQEMDYVKTSDNPYFLSTADLQPLSRIDSLRFWSSLPSQQTTKLNLQVPSVQHPS